MAFVCGQRVVNRKRSRFIGSGVGIVCLSMTVAATLCLLLNVVVSPKVLREEAKEHSSIYGVYGEEKASDGTTFSWTKSHATVTFPYAANLGQQTHVTLKIAGSRPAGKPQARVKVSLNGAPQASFDVANLFQTYTATVDTQHIPTPFLTPRMYRWTWTAHPSPHRKTPGS